MSSNNLPHNAPQGQVPTPSNTWIRLSNDTFVRVPDGADVNAFRRVQEARLKLAANPKKQTQRTYQSKRNHNASAVLACGGSPFDAGMLAVAELVERVNGRLCVSCQFGQHCGSCSCCSGRVTL